MAAVQPIVVPVAMRPMQSVSSNPVRALIESAGLVVTDVQSILIEPQRVTFQCLARDKDGKARAAGDRAATDTFVRAISWNEEDA